MNFDPVKLVSDIKELIMIPDIGESFFHKVEELKGLLKDDIEYYQDLGLIETKSPPSFDGQPFEIFKRGKQWETSSDIPGQILEYIIKSDLTPGVPKMERRLQFQGLSGRYTATFEKKDDRHFTGTIQIERKEKTTTTAPPGPGSHLRVLQPPPQKDELREFLYFLASNQELYNHVLNEYRLKWKPSLLLNAK